MPDYIDMTNDVAKTEHKLGNNNEAKKIYEMYVKNADFDYEPDTVIEYIDFLIDQNESKKALKVLDNLFKKYPKTSDSLYKKSAIEFRLNCSEDAFKTLKKAMEVSFKHNNLLFEFAPELEHSKSINGFIKEFEKLNKS